MEVGDVVMEVVVDVVVMVAIHFGLCNLYCTHCGRYHLLTIECPITSYVINVEIVYSFEYCLSHRKASEGILKTRSALFMSCSWPFIYKNFYCCKLGRI